MERQRKGPHFQDANTANGLGHGLALHADFSGKDGACEGPVPIEEAQGGQASSVAFV